MSCLFWFLFFSFWIGVATVIWYTLDTRRAYTRIAGGSTIVPSPLGDIEFKRGGASVPVLVIHGSGGGYDQGELIAMAILDERFDWITPSRFGYLGSTFHVGATFDEQAKAYALLLDHLGLKRVAVLAMSHGGPSALLFAALYPDRVSSLTLLSCGVASSSDTDQAEASQKGDALTMIFKYEILYWLVRTFMRKQLMRLMGASGRVIAGLTTEQRTLVNRVIDYMAPVAPATRASRLTTKPRCPTSGWQPFVPRRSSSMPRTTRCNFFTMLSMRQLIFPGHAWFHSIGAATSCSWSNSRLSRRKSGSSYWPMPDDVWSPGGTTQHFASNLEHCLARPW